jgi:hypothetical protein
MTKQIDGKARVLEALTVLDTVSTHDATVLLGISGNTFTKYVSMLRREQKNIVRTFRKCKLTGRRVAEYRYIPLVA